MTLLLVALVMGLFVWLGYKLARELGTAERAELDVQRQVLDAEWTALEQARQVNDVFFQARDQLRRPEANE